VVRNAYVVARLKTLAYSPFNYFLTTLEQPQLLQLFGLGVVDGDRGSARGGIERGGMARVRGRWGREEGRERL
jgi:hypothetical protein